MNTNSTLQEQGSGSHLQAACRVYVADDSTAIRQRLVRLIESSAEVRVVGESGSPAAAVEGILRTRPDFAILDFHLEGGTGLEVLRAIRAAGSTVPVAMFSNEVDAGCRRSCLAAGAQWFLDKSSEFATIREISAGLAARRTADRRQPCLQ